MCEPVLLPVTKIQRFCTHDGPGIRTTVFLKGCPLRCRWCHNPETQNPAPQLLYSAQLCVGCGGCAEVCPNSAHQIQAAGHVWQAARCTGCGSCAAVCPTAACEPAARDMDIPALISAVCQDAAFYGESGGMTVSGGEPMFHAAKCLALLQAARAAGVHTALETCGYFPARYIPALTALTDLFLWDVKDTDPDRHRQNTGVPPALILNNLRQVDAAGGHTRLRCILLAGVNLNDDHLAAIADIYHGLRHCQGVDLIPYHAYGGSKAVQLGGQDTGHPDWIPTPEALAAAQAFLQAQGVHTAVM